MNTVLLDLETRAARYDGTLSDILNKTPTYLWDSPSELEAFWDGRDLSHIFPQSTHPELAMNWNNIVAENSSINRARGAEVMTQEELELAEFDNQIEALELDLMYTDDSVEFTEVVLDLIAA